MDVELVLNVYFVDVLYTKSKLKSKNRNVVLVTEKMCLSISLCLFLFHRNENVCELYSKGFSLWKSGMIYYYVTNENGYQRVAKINERKISRGEYATQSAWMFFSNKVINSLVYCWWSSSYDSILFSPHLHWWPFISALLYWFSVCHSNSGKTKYVDRIMHTQPWKVNPRETDRET